MTKKGTRKRGRGKEREDERGPESAADQTLTIPSAESELFLLLDITAEPGEDGWQYCSLPVHSSLVSSLAERWPEAEKIYALSFRDAFRCLRQERDALCHYIFSKRNELIEFLKRPDCKQEFVSQWQREYNELSLNMRQQDFMKSELHHRVD
uniref:Uncharacterized protein n=1 Tax=Amphimedon queenslandica TaxID=400682 RepID=A0A1X7SDX8_AMPQE